MPVAGERARGSATSPAVINWFHFDKLGRMLRESGFREVYLTAPQQSLFAEARGPRFDTRPSYSLHVDCVNEDIAT